MTRRQQFEQLVESYAEYEGPRSYDLKFLITLVCDLQIALDEITLCDSLQRAQEIAGEALERENT